MDDITKPPEMEFYRIAALKHTVPETSPYRILEPHIRVMEGCHTFPAISADGHQSSGLTLSGNTRCDGRLGERQLYARWWVPPDHSDKRIMLYAMYFPRLETFDTLTETSMNHRHQWLYYAVLSNTADGRSPYACAYYNMGVFGDDWETHSWQYCTQGKRETRASIRIYPNGVQASDRFVETGDQGLIAWEFLTGDQMVTFDSADWGPYKVCLMIDAHFNSEMIKLYHYTKRWIPDTHSDL